MAKGKQNRKHTPPAEPPRDCYNLKRQAVEDLVTANEENSPPVSQAELKKYRTGPRIKLAVWVKALLLKFWTGGMICYFFVWGLSALAVNQWDHLLILGISLGLVTNLITNNIFRFIASTPGEYDRWMMVPGKKAIFLPLDILYALLLVVCTMMTYNGVNLLLTGGGASPALGVEPFLFGLIVTLWDLLFLGAKRLMHRVVEDARQKVRRGE